MTVPELSHTRRNILLACLMTYYCLIQLFTQHKIATNKKGYITEMCLLFHRHQNVHLNPCPILLIICRKVETQ
jgi:hypothetical protein